MSEARRPESIDLYELLEVSPHASQTVIHAAYRALVKDAHPDTNPAPEAAQRFKMLSAAYSVLSDPQDRARYDLECARARRHDQVAHPVAVSAPTRAPHAAARTRALPVRKGPLTASVDDRVSNLAGHAILALIMLAALSAFILVFVWVLDPALEPVGSAYGGFVLDVPRR